MNGGLGETSYAQNSSLQKAVISKVKPTLQKCVVDVYCTVFPECLRIADLGCSSGPNTLTVVTEILNTIDATCRFLNKKPPAFQVFLNDLPGNDFNTIFQSLPSFYERLKKEKGATFGPCFVTGMPGSFYGRLFPTNFMHIIHSSYSLHWLSQAPKGLVSKTGEPMNKGTIYISETSSPMVFKAYLDQFMEDFTLFLRSRSEEIVPGGSMILTIIGRADQNNPKSIWEVLGRALYNMVLEGLIEETKLDHFNLPYYTPHAREVTKVIEEEGSFSLQNLDTFEIGWDAGFREPAKNSGIPACEDHLEQERARYISDYMRAIGEPMLVKQFGQTVMDDLYERYFIDKINESLEKEKWQFVNLVISLTKTKLA